MTRRLHAATLLLIAVAATACSTTDPAPRESRPPVRPPASATQRVVPSPSPAPTPRDTPSPPPEPGQPFRTDDILEAMRTSRRPGGVPDQMETAAVAGAVAGEIWTVDARPWTTITAGGSCGPVRCTLEVAGTRAGYAGEDVWIFEVIPAADEVALLDATLRSMPVDLVEELDELAREELSEIDAEDLLLVTARWLPPPDDGRFELSYRSGGEEGSCELEVVVDVAEGPQAEIVDATGC